MEYHQSRKFLDGARLKIVVKMVTTTGSMRLLHQSKIGDGEIYEYQSVRTLPDRDIVKRSEKVYKQISAGKNTTSIKI